MKNYYYLCLSSYVMNLSIITIKDAELLVPILENKKEKERILF